MRESDIYRAMYACVAIALIIVASVGIVCYYKTSCNVESDYGIVESQSLDVDYGGVKVSGVVSVYDGDTFKVNIAEWPDIIGSDISVRVAGVDTPEMSETRPELQELAERAKQFAETKLGKAKVIELVEIRRDKYFRILARVLVDGKDLGKMLVDAKLGKPYDGGTKPTWTMSDYRKYND